MTAAEMLWGYANGVFPMAVSASDPTLYWFDPEERGIIPVGGVRVSRSMRGHLARSGWRAVLNRDFAATVHACAARDKTWINDDLHRLYGELHAAGHAHALDVVDGAGAVAGGIFGITLGGAFFGESMFSAQTNGSKAALIWMSSHLARCGFTLFDTQYPTPHLQSMGGQTVPRAVYRARLESALAQRADIRAQPVGDACS